MSSESLIMVTTPEGGQRGAGDGKPPAPHRVGSPAAVSTADGRRVLLGCDRAELEAFVLQLGEPAYRGRQLALWLYGQGVRSFAEMSDLPASLRDRLAEVAVVGRSTLVTAQRSRDGTT